MDFPHLQGDTPFPGSDAHVYEQYANTHDYHMWTPRTKIKPCNVKWRDGLKKCDVITVTGTGT